MDKRPKEELKKEKEIAIVFGISRNNVQCALFFKHIYPLVFIYCSLPFSCILYWMFSFVSSVLFFCKSVMSLKIRPVAGLHFFLGGDSVITRDVPPPPSGEKYAPRKFLLHSFLISRDLPPSGEKYTPRKFLVICFVISRLTPPPPIWRNNFYVS